MRASLPLPPNRHWPSTRRWTTNHRGLYETNRYRRLGSIVIGFSERPRDSATFCLIPVQDDPDTVSIVADHNKAPGRAPDGKGLITVLLSHEYLNRTDHLPDEDILDRALESVKKYYGGLPGEVEEHAVVRWAESVPTIDKGRFRRIADFPPRCRPHLSRPVRQRPGSDSWAQRCTRER